MKPVRVAIIGAGGWMGRVHFMGYANIPFIFGNRHALAEIAWLVESDERRLGKLKALAPASKISTDWSQAIHDPSVDLVDICVPDHLHYEIARAALAAGKHIYCEKPFTDTPQQARELAEAAHQKGVVTRIGHNFPKNPVHDIAKELIDSGEIGKIQLVKASQHVDVMADPDAPFMWRCDGKLARTGIVGDTGSHVFSFLHYLVGEVDEVVADCNIFTAKRPKGSGAGYASKAAAATASELVDVTNVDATNLLCRFTCGAMGIADFSRVASGQKFHQSYQIYGTKGGLKYDYDHINRIHFYSPGDVLGGQGYKAIDVGPENATYGSFYPVANFGLGYNEYKLIEIAEVVRSVAKGTPCWPTFSDGLHITQLVEACLESSSRRQWVKVKDL